MLEKMGTFFDNRVDTYDEHQQRTNACFDEVYPATVRLLPTAPGAKVLDLGCGTGIELEHYYKLNPSADITGIDLSVGMLNALKQKFPDKNIRLITGSYFDVPFEESYYDAAVSAMSLHHFKQSMKIPLYAKICRALKPGCSFVLNDYFTENDEAEQERFANLARLKAEQNINDDEFYHYDTPLTIAHEIEALRQGGFKDIEIAFKWDLNVTFKAAK